MQHPPLCWIIERHLCSAFLPLQVSQLVGKPAHQCEALYKQHALYLNLASQLIQKEAFMGMVRSSQERDMQVSTPISSANLTLALQQAHLLHMQCKVDTRKSPDNCPLQNQMHHAGSAHFSGELQQHGSRSISTSAAVHSPRKDSLHGTPRHHIKPREPASMPKVTNCLAQNTTLCQQGCLTPGNCHCGYAVALPSLPHHLKHD